MTNVLLISLISSITMGNAQFKNEKTENVKIYGDCDLCENSIEKAGNLKNEAMIDWNKDTKIATISYDSHRTSKGEILKRIALAGYDSDSFLAPDDTYMDLPYCCQYIRPKKGISLLDEPKMEMTTTNHSNHVTVISKIQDANPLSAVYEGYFAIKDALVKSEGASASTNAQNLLKVIAEVKMDKLPMDVHMAWMKALETLKSYTQAISDTEDVKKQRDKLDVLSKNIYELIKISKYKTPAYYQFCPMANGGKGANWLSKDETIKNPYYGSQMLSCGKTVETIQE